MLLIPRLSGIKELGTRVSQGSEGVSKRFGGPDVIAIEGDMLPAEGRDVGENLVGEDFATGAQLVDGAPQIDGVPEDDGGDREVETGSTVALIFESPVTDFAKAMKEYGSFQRIMGFAFVRARIGSAAQCWIADPVEGEDRSVEPSDGD